MVSFSKNILAILNILTFLLSIPILLIGIYLAVRSSTDCEKFLRAPFIAVGAILMAVSVAGFVGACFRVRWLLLCYLVVTFLLILFYLCVVIFDFAVTSKGGGGEAAVGRGFEEYRLQDYSHWLRERVEDKEKWRKLRSCLIYGKACQDMKERNQSYEQFFKSKLSPVESGCCKPPLECGFTYQNATVWTTPSTGFSSNNTDCNTWKNDPNVLCYDCQSCKAGVVANTKGHWKKTAIANSIILAFLIVVYGIGCHVFIRSKKDTNTSAGWKGPA